MIIPPYGKPLRDLLKSGSVPRNSVYLYVGKGAWQEGNWSSRIRPTRTLALPDGESPLNYHWPVQNCDILVIETTRQEDEYIEVLVQDLFCYGATKVHVISPEFELNIYKKDF